MTNNDPDRNITDADARVIAEAIRDQVVKQFYNDFGKGLWGFVWKGLLILFLAIAAYGASRGMH